MTEENAILEIEWEDEVPEIDEDFTPIVEFGTMQFLGAKKVTVFGSGMSITLDYTLPDGTKFTRGGMREGHTPKGQLVESEKNTTAYFIAHKLFNKDGEPYTAVVSHMALPTIPVEDLSKFPYIKLNDNQQKAIEKNGVAWCAQWSNFQFPALKSLPAKARDDFGKGKEIHYKAHTTVTRTQEVEDKKYRDKYRHTFTIFNTHEEMVAARESQVSSNGTEASYYPDDWGNAVEDMIKHGKELVVENPDVDHKELATTLQLLVNGDPAQTADGEPCDVKRILAEVLDCSKPMVKI